MVTRDSLGAMQQRASDNRGKSRTRPRAPRRCCGRGYPDRQCQSRTPDSGKGHDPESSSSWTAVSGRRHCRLLRQTSDYEGLPGCTASLSLFSGLAVVLTAVGIGRHGSGGGHCCRSRPWPPRERIALHRSAHRSDRHRFMRDSSDPNRSSSQYTEHPARSRNRHLASRTPRLTPAPSQASHGKDSRRLT